MSTFLLLVCSFQIYSGLMKWLALNKTASKRLRNGHFKCCISLICPLPYMYLIFIQIAMLYLVHKYKKKVESTNMDLTHSNITIFSSFSS